MTGRAGRLSRLRRAQRARPVGRRATDRRVDRDRARAPSATSQRPSIGDHAPPAERRDATRPAKLKFVAIKRVSVAEAKNTLPALLHEAENEPVEILRHGKPVAVLLSRSSYDRLRDKHEGVWAALERFRETHDLEEMNAASAFEALRDTSPAGRAVRW